MRWNEGRAAVEGLIDRDELQRVPPDPALVAKLLDSARLHLASAELIRARDPEGAYATLYDAARKACVALLGAQGLRPTSRGGHVAVRDAVGAQFASLTGGHVLKAFDRIRRRRHDIEYPDGDSGIDADEIHEAWQRAKEIVAFAVGLVDQLEGFR